MVSGGKSKRMTRKKEQREANQEASGTGGDCLVKKGGFNQKKKTVRLLDKQWREGTKVSAGAQASSLQKVRPSVMPLRKPGYAPDDGGGHHCGRRSGPLENDHKDENSDRKQKGAGKVLAKNGEISTKSYARTVGEVRAGPP